MTRHIVTLKRANRYGPENVTRLASAALGKTDKPAPRIVQTLR